ncbi:MAG: hypothetical protein WD208_07140 [Dehalococcoidia bacterium]
MKSLTFSAMRRVMPRFAASFDSTSGMVRANGRYLRGKDLPGAGIQPDMPILGAAVNALPKAVREQLYIWSGWMEAIPPEKAGDIRAEEFSKWVVSEYPERDYPAVMIGSSNGAMTHLACAMGIPFLPQTFLIPVRQPQVHPDEPWHGMEEAKEPAHALLQANPELELHHMHDANQDRLMIERMTYFRTKRLTLGETYEQFLLDHLPEGGTIFLVECELKWPTTQIADRHIFQTGALGGATPEEFLHGGERVEEYLKRYGSHRRKWVAPEPDGDRPEAEWGFAPELREDLEKLARRRGYRIRRVVFDHPENVSPLVADLYRWWYRERQLPPNRLLAECFVIMDPWWAMRTGSAPYWMVFNKEESAENLEKYLDSAEAYDYIHMMLLSHGVESVGLVPIERWKSILDRGRKGGGFIGMEEEKYPRDFGVFARYNRDLSKIPARYAMPGPLPESQLDKFLEQSGDKYGVQWIEHPVAATV